MKDEGRLAVEMLEMWECRKCLKCQKTLQHTLIAIVSSCRTTAANKLIIHSLP